jgi:hypothetical protein
MLRFIVKRPHPDRVEQMLDWFAELEGPRRDEAVATFGHEGIRHEQAVLVQTSDGPLLVYMMEIDESAPTTPPAERPAYAIDTDHRNAMTTALDLEHEVDARVVLDLRAG